MFIDTSVVMYVAGAEHPQRAPCQLVLRRVADGDIDAMTSTEVVQEILHRFARSRRDTGQRMGDGVAGTVRRDAGVFGDHPMPTRSRRCRLRSPRCPPS